MESQKRFESYYSVLGISANCSVDEIRRAYRKLAMQWHPDRCARKNPSMLAEAKRKFQKIQEAYSVLSDPNKREMYDAGLYDPNDEEDEGFYDFMHEMFDLMAQVGKEEKPCSMEDLQNSFSEFLESFQTPQWIPSPLNQMTNSRGLQQSTSGSSLSPEMPASDLKMFGVNSSFCRLNV